MAKSVMAKANLFLVKMERAVGHVMHLFSLATFANMMAAMVA